jgi:hypothetical protein
MRVLAAEARRLDVRPGAKGSAASKMPVENFISADAVVSAASCGNPCQRSPRYERVAAPFQSEDLPRG